MKEREEEEDEEKNNSSVGLMLLGAGYVCEKVCAGAFVLCMFNP